MREEARTERLSQEPEPLVSAQRLVMGHSASLVIMITIMHLCQASDQYGPEGTYYITEVILCVR